MKLIPVYFTRLLFAILVASAVAVAQPVTNVTIMPSLPNSADTIILRLTTGVAFAYVGDAYRVRLAGNTLRVTLGARVARVLPPVLPPTIPGAEFTYVQIGNLPAGSYLIDVVQAGQNGASDVLVASGMSFEVTDARATKSAPYVRLNYSDHWWKPTESGWGLFIWQDRLDRVLAAWFTYGADGKPTWYTVQLGQWTSTNTYEGQVIQSTGPSFLNFAPGSTVGVQAVGTAKLVFSDANNGTFTYTVQNVTQSKEITRFRP